MIPIDILLIRSIVKVKVKAYHHLLGKGGISVLQTSLVVGRLFQWYHSISLTFDLAQGQICCSYSGSFQFHMYVSTSLLYRAVPAGCREHPSDDRE